MRKQDVKIGGLFYFMDLPTDMRRYIKHFGMHFNRKLYEFAVSKMFRKVKDSEKIEKTKPIEKSKFDELLTKYGIKLQYDDQYDGVFVYSMAISDFYESSLPSEKEVVCYVKDYVDDIDQLDGFIFNRWVADMYFSGQSIDWEEYM